MLKKTIESLNPYVPEVPLADLEKQLGVPKIVRMSANENPFGTSDQVRQAVLNWNFNQARDYPDGDAEQLRQAVADFVQVDPKQLLFGCGLDEVIELVARTFIEPGDEVLEPWPTFSEYKLHAEIEDAKIVDVPVNDTTGQFDLEALAAAITPKTKLIWLCNPNNPTGTYLQPEAIRDFLKKVPANVLVLLDEAYMEFVTEVAQPSALPLLKEFDNLVLMRTFSKIYGLASFRVGYAVIPKALISSMQSVRLPYNLNTLSQVAALAALQDQDFVATTRKRVAEARQSWEAFLDQQGLHYYHSQANFVFFNAPRGDALKDYLLKNGYLVRSGLRPDWLRITYGSTEQNAAVQKLITTFYAAA